MGFEENIEQENYITVYPDGKRDFLGQSQCWSSWNAVGGSNNSASVGGGAVRESSCSPPCFIAEADRVLALE